MLLRFHLLYSFDARSANREGAYSLPHRQANNTLPLRESALPFGCLKSRLRTNNSYPDLLRTACLVPVRAWVVVGLPQIRSTTNLHGPPNPLKSLKCCRRPPARKRQLTQPAGPPKQAYSLTLYEQSRPPPLNQPNIIHLHPPNTSTNTPLPPGPTTRRHTAMTLEILAPVHLGILSPNRPRRRHQRVHLIRSLHPCHRTLLSLCRTPVGPTQLVRLRILLFASHPRARTKIGTKTPEVANGNGHLIPTPRRPLGNPGTHMTRGNRSIIPQRSVGTSRNGRTSTLYQSLPAIGVISQKMML